MYDVYKMAKEILYCIPIILNHLLIYIFFKLVRINLIYFLQRNIIKTKSFKLS